MISPLLKRPGLDPDDLMCFHPISNLPLLGKVMEKVVAHQIMQHLDAHGLFDSFQSAYWARHSTETALLKIKCDMDLALDQGNDVMILVLLDLNAAFDTIDHTILLERLESHCGIIGAANEWVRSYLITWPHTEL